MTEQTLSNACPTREPRVTDASVDIAERIRILADAGLKVRDIASILHLHPMIVIRTLGEREVQS